LSGQVIDIRVVIAPRFSLTDLARGRVVACFGRIYTAASCSKAAARASAARAIPQFVPGSIHAGSAYLFFSRLVGVIDLPRRTGVRHIGSSLSIIRARSRNAAAVGPDTDQIHIEIATAA
jgi:hypothetical protein